MSKDNGIDIEPEVAEKVTEYVYKNYKNYKDKPLIIKDRGSYFTILGLPLLPLLVFLCFIL